MREAHATTNLLYEGWAYLPLTVWVYVLKLLQPLVEQLALIDGTASTLLALRYFDLRWLHTTNNSYSTDCQGFMAT